MDNKFSSMGFNLTPIQASFMMLFSHYGVESDFFYKYFTLEQLNHQSDSNNPCKLFYSYPYGEDVIHMVGDILGISSFICRYEWKGNSCDDLEKWLISLPHEKCWILGPFNQDKLWDRLETKFSDVYGNYMCLLPRNEDGQLLFQDPNGYPFCKISILMLFKACYYTNYLVAFSLDEKPILNSKNELAIKIADRYIDNRRILSVDKNKFSCGLEITNKKLLQNKLSIFEKTCLQYCIANLSCGLQSTLEFTYEFQVNQALDKKTRQLLYKSIELFLKYEKNTASALYYLINEDLINLSRDLESMIKIENQLDELFLG